MAKIGISETQFAFMFFHKFSNLYNDNFQNIIALSTYQEGNLENLYRGTDLVIDQFFIQFKLPSYIIKFGNSLFEEYYEEAPYFSYEIYNRSNDGHHGQYDFLKLHSQDLFNTVLYISPSFRKTLSRFSEEESFWFRNFYRSNPVNIDQYSCSVNLVDLNWIWNNEDKHHISYKDEDSYVNAHSKAKEIKKSSLEEILKFDIEKVKRSIYLDQCIKDLNKYLSKPILSDERGLFNITQIQLQILSEYNVHWIPSIDKSQDRNDEVFKKINK